MDKENYYKTVRIGNQIWMAENLQSTKYRNGDPINYIDDPDEWCNTFEVTEYPFWNSTLIGHNIRYIYRILTILASIDSSR